MRIDFLARIMSDGKLFLNQNLKIAWLLLPNVFLFIETSHNPEVDICFYNVKNILKVCE